MGDADEDDAERPSDHLHKTVNGDGYRAVRVVDADAEEEECVEDGHCCPCSLRNALLAPLIILLALVGVAAIAASLLSIRAQCQDKNGWQCWQRTAITQWLPPLSLSTQVLSSSLPFLLSSSSPPTPRSPSLPWLPSSSPAAVNAVRLARVFDRLERGLPIVVGAVGGSNMQGHALNWTETVLPVLTRWLNEHFPVTASADALQADHSASLLRDCGNRSTGRQGPARSASAVPRHVFFNAAAGGTTSGLTSFCYRRLVPQCDHHGGTFSDADAHSYHDPDLLLVDFAVNDVIEDDPFSASPPAANIERLVRQVLGHTSHTAVVMVYFAMLLTYGLRTGEHIHHPVALHYHLPEVSIRHFALEWLYEPQYEFNRLQHLDDLREQRPVPLDLPLPLVEALKKVNGGQHVNFDSLFWFNGYHLNELGHRILVALASRQLLTLYRALRANAYTSFADPTLLPDGLTASLPSLLDPATVQAATLPSPLATQLAATDAQEFTCTVMYYPYNPTAAELDQAAAERFMDVDTNHGWLYARHGQTNKFAMAVPEADAQSEGQYLRLALPSTVHSLSAVFVRSWNASMMGEATMWMSCGEQGGGAAVDSSLPTGPYTASSRSTPPIVLNGSWSQTNTQLDLQQIWPLDAPVLAQVAGDNNGQGYQPPSCEMRFGNIRHTRRGEFRFVGIVWN